MYEVDVELEFKMAVIGTVLTVLGTVNVVVLVKVVMVVDDKGTAEVNVLAPVPVVVSVTDNVVNITFTVVVVAPTGVTDTTGTTWHTTNCPSVALQSGKSFT